MHHTEKYPQHSSVIWQVWLNGLRTKRLWVRIFSNTLDNLRKRDFGLKFPTSSRLSTLKLEKRLKLFAALEKYLD